MLRESRNVVYNWNIGTSCTFSFLVILYLPDVRISRDILPWAVDSTSWPGRACWAWWRRRRCTRKLARLRRPTTCTGLGSSGCNVGLASRSTQTRCSFAERGQQLDLDATDCGPIKKDSRLNPLNKKLCGSESQNIKIYPCLLQKVLVFPLWPNSTSHTSVQVSTNKNEIHCYLIFVKLTVLEGGLALRLEGHDDEADEDVHHEEGDDDDVDEVEKRDIGTIVVNWTMVDFVGVDGHV